jgi:hypothetical protein
MNQSKPSFSPEVKKLLYLLFLCILGLSCKKETGKLPRDGENNNILNKVEAKAYVNDRLSKYARVIASLSRSTYVRKVVNQGIAKKFDGDYNILIKDLYKMLASPGTDQATHKLAPPSEEPGVDPPSPVDLTILGELLLEPVLVNNDTLYPQIYIPFSEPEQVDEGMEGVLPADPCANVAPLSPTEVYPYPVIVSYDGDESSGQEVFTGSSYDHNGIAIDGIQVSECFAKRHPVWAVTINERVDQSGRFPGDIYAQPSTGNAPTPIGADLYMPDIVVKQHKESWIKGGSEIQMQFGVSWANGTNPSTAQTRQFKLYSQTSLSQDAPIDITFLSRSQIRNKRTVPINFTYAPLSSWGERINVSYVENNVTKYRSEIQYYNYPTKGDYLYLIVYEYDDHFWEYFLGNGTSYATGGMGIPDQTGNYLTNFYFKSNEGPYLQTSFKIIQRGAFQSGANSGNYDINTDQLYFKSRHRTY